jgi:hypothetical protein
VKHSLLVALEGHDNSTTLAMCHSVVKHFLDKNHFVAYSVESSTDEAGKRMDEDGIISNVNSLVKLGSLAIFDRDTATEMKVKFSGEKLRSKWKSIVLEKHSASRQQRKKKVAAICPSFPLLINNQYYHALLGFEKVLQTEQEVDGEAVCFCTCDSLMALSCSELIEYLMLHNFTIHANMVYCEVSWQRIVNLIRQAMGNVTGNATAELTLKTLKIIYRMEESEIAANPYRFEEILKRLFGKSAPSFLEETKRLMVSDVLFQKST